MKSNYLILLLLLSTASLARADEYPTLERVDHVLTCMRENGGQNVDNLYACSCEVDIIAQAVPFDEFTEARTFEIYKRMPGERGGLFRDNDRAKVVVTKLEAARADAKKRCFIGTRMKNQKLPPGPAAPAARLGGEGMSGAPPEKPPGPDHGP